MVTQNPDDDFPFEDRDFQEARAGEESERGRESRSGRKERVLHTRISEQLSEEIRRAAEDLRVPASNLVRNVLEEAFGAVERVTDEVGGFIEEMLGDAEGTRSDLRRIGRRFQRLARRQRRRFAGHGSFWDDRDEPGEDDDAPRREGAPPASPPSEPAPASAAAPSFPDVIGWQPLLVNTACECAACARPLAAGERAFNGATERGLSRIFVCGSCMRARSGA